jgi:NADH:ubiquinone oxidoreductase subunit B-like Fe-S oxidoreductase
MLKCSIYPENSYTGAFEPKFVARCGECISQWGTFSASSVI